jgi:hypothetical protein
MARGDLGHRFPPRRWTAIGALLLAAAAAGAAPARPADRCVARRDAPVQALSSIGLDPRGFPATLAGVPGRAVALWDRRDCIRDSDFPTFSLAPGSGQRRIEILYRPGPSSVLPSACGEFTGSRIVLHGRYLDPRTRRAASCGGADRLVETLAHELGHALGLVDQFDAGCSDHIMAQLGRAPDGTLAARSVQADECRAAGRGFATLFERALATDRGRLAPGPEANPRTAGLRPGPVLPPGRPPGARTAHDSRETGSAEYRP